ncbi:hypothetical protein AZE42_02297 [Rhizopogon vesiculosus]|uniref:HTH CENPB-type domain-containing protein n=1 Tax=Rhizopogon vesiculosus TaxID=180088 RepID=A0A1J8Q0D3_9AGAM|nr:hypothetical protein AZE42_02297 [Rhizopogon vesiculosus]
MKRRKSSQWWTSATITRIQQPIHEHSVIVLEMVGSYLGKNWVHRFVSRHPDMLDAKPRGPDPKRAQNFNKATITVVSNHPFWEAGEAEGGPKTSGSRL